MSQVKDTIIEHGDFKSRPMFMVFGSSVVHDAVCKTSVMCVSTSIEVL